MLFKKSLLALMSVTLSSNTFVLASSSQANYLDLDDETFIKETMNRIENYSQFYSNDRVYQYQNENYRNENSIYEKILAENPIEQIQTTSNPNKIISNYEYGLLNQDKIYSTNMADYVKVYKNALGKVVLPTCGVGQTPEGCVVSSKSAPDRALDSYVNPGLTKKKYSYLMGDEVNWFDTLEEAERDYLNKSFYVKEGLFYEYNGKYFNAFNQNDFEKLKNTLPNKGLYIDGENLPSNSQNEIKKPLYGTVTDFKNQFKEEVRTAFYNNIDEIFGDYKPEIKVTVDAGKEKNLQQYFTSVNGTGKIQIDNQSSWKSLTINIGDDLRKKGIDIGGFIESLKDRSKYKGPWITFNKKVCFLGTVDDNKHDNYDYEFDFGQGSKVSFTVATQDDGWCDPGYNHVNLGAMKVDYSYERKIKPNYKVNDPFLKTITENNKYLDSIKTIEIDQMIREISSKNRVSDKILLESILNKKNPSNWAREVKDYLFEAFYEKCSSYVYGYDSIDSPIENDWLYGSYSQFSVVESQKHYKENVLYSEIKPDPNIDESQKINYLTSAGFFNTSWKNWRDNFFYLRNEINNPDLNLQKMYYLSNDNEEDLSNYTDLKGDNLGSTIQEARKKQASREEKHIRTRLFIYDINGELVISDDDEENAYLDLRKKINLESRLISYQESKKISNLNTGWNDIISDGIYNVYRFKTKDNIYLYFSSFSNAFSYYEKQFSISSSISYRDEIKYRYVFTMHNHKYTYDWTNKSEIYDIALEINQLRKMN
ncbi:hypothetical protein [Spiroplasma alleghenense]|uniref:Uncharacterized protein n=1 Tax=Spiroplasma alleghenense TaxID=216931 RepID=A0A345Z2H2_9MOLU|nr:hypothetical protein [Spiroplasma alleghenense]AXK50801.1 hypothetical protein SALLE_v1c01250 [Spiroplasma alleghenense]